ncbi:hypothetical protein RSOLAG1IB_06849 [Rhizoctonia solani AG-1 IB]|uniref:Uncharacterized protein n=1 Tax=Thanatephorus cucumeris (strain AG1-IB / isolate 7/3/14) TaxID=1108050 RepID=A0A0B7FD97_THACB|nr:hypothetical protein RSOLAG1IB_06849 [Rhizoctonia solani AG-1 IB]
MAKSKLPNERKYLARGQPSDAHHKGVFRFSIVLDPTSPTTIIHLNCWFYPIDSPIPSQALADPISRHSNPLSTQLHFPPINSPWPLPPTNAVSIPTTTSLTLGIDGLSGFGQWLRLSDPIGTVPDAADSHISSPSLRAIISLELCTCSVSTSVLCHHTGRPDAVPPLFPLSSPSLSSSLPPDLCSQPATFGSLSVVSVSQTLGPHDPTASLTPFVCHLFGITVHSIYALRRGVYVGTFRA